MHIDLFHGTSEYFAQKLVTESPVNPLKAAGVFDLSARLYEICLKEFHSFSNLWKLYSEDSGLRTTAAIALRSIYEGNQSSLMSYGALYGALKKSTAANYACRGHLGSELLWIVRETINSLGRIVDHDVEEIVSDYPDIVRLLSVHSSPIVLRFRVPVAQLRNEAGGTISREHCEEIVDLYSMPGVYGGDAFRIEGSGHLLEGACKLRIPTAYNPTFDHFPDDEERFLPCPLSDLGYRS